MEKLELKHLAPYLPYGLKVRYNNKEYLVHAIEVKGRLMLETEPMYVVFMNIKYVKPILRPLYSMTEKEAYEFGVLLIGEADMEDKEVKIGDTAVMGDVYPTIMYEDKEDEDYSVMIQFGSMGISMCGLYVTPHEAYEWLFKNHFDVFGLIDEGLAIDKNINTK